MRRILLIRELEDLLITEAKKRYTKSVEQWIEDERTVMLEAVNKRRTVAGKLPVSRSDVERVERSAVGHSDYGHKFAIYCADLVED